MSFGVDNTSHMRTTISSSQLAAMDSLFFFFFHENSLSHLKNARHLQIKKRKKVNRN